MRYLLIMITLLMGCDQDTGLDYSEPSIVEIRRAVDIFEITFKVRAGSDIIFDYSPYEGSVAHCLVQTNLIILNAEFWRNMKPLDREAVVFHELVHCQLKMNYHWEGFEPQIMDSFHAHIVIGYRDHFDRDVKRIKEEYENEK